MNTKKIYISDENKTRLAINAPETMGKITRTHVDSTRARHGTYFEVPVEVYDDAMDILSCADLAIDCAQLDLSKTLLQE